jgi:uncharacterized protein YndB with AHSA1/START domain
MQEIDVKAESEAAPERVWALLADARSWPRWAPFDEAMVEEGAGLGELRRFQTGRRTTRERVTGFEPPKRLEYELVSGIPIHDYRAEVTLAPAGDGTAIRWHSHFRAKIPGTGGLARRSLERFIEQTAEGLAREAEKAPVSQAPAARTGARPTPNRPGAGSAGSDRP